MSDYGRNFYDRKTNKALKIILLLAMVGFALYAANMVSTSIYDVTLMDLVRNYIGR